MAYRGAMRIKCLAQGHTTENSSEAGLEPPTNLLIVIREAYPLDHWVPSHDRYMIAAIFNRTLGRAATFERSPQRVKVITKATCKTPKNI